MFRNTSVELRMFRDAITRIGPVNDIKKLTALLNELGQEVSEEEAHRDLVEITGIHSEGVGKVFSFDTLEKILARRKRQHFATELDPESEILQAFFAMGGTISPPVGVPVEVLQRAVDVFNLNPSVREVIEVLDVDQSGSIEFDEFCDIFTVLKGLQSVNGLYDDVDLEKSIDDTIFDPAIYVPPASFYTSIPNDSLAGSGFADKAKAPRFLSSPVSPTDSNFSGGIFSPTSRQVHVEKSVLGSLNPLIRFKSSKFSLKVKKIFNDCGVMEVETPGVSPTKCTGPLGGPPGGTHSSGGASRNSRGLSLAVGLVREVEDGGGKMLQKETPDLGGRSMVSLDVHGDRRVDEGRARREDAVPMIPLFPPPAVLFADGKLAHAVKKHKKVYGTAPSLVTRMLEKQSREMEHLLCEKSEAEIVTQRSNKARVLTCQKYLIPQSRRDSRLRNVYLHRALPPLPTSEYRTLELNVVVSPGHLAAPTKLSLSVCSVPNLVTTLWQRLKLPVNAKARILFQPHRKEVEGIVGGKVSKMKELTSLDQLEDCESTVYLRCT